MFGELIKDAAAGVGGIKTAIDLMKSLRDLYFASNDVKGQDEGARIILELQKRLSDILQEHLTMQERLFQLEQAQKRRKRFGAEKKKFVLKETYPRSFAYVERQPGEDSAATLYLCTKCFGDDQRSLLQLKKRDFNFDLMGCQTCGGETHIANDIRATIQSSGPRRDWRGW